ANAVLAKRPKAAALRVGQLRGEGIPAGRSRGDDNVALSCRPLLLASGDAAGSRAALGFVEPNEPRDVAGPRTHGIRRRGESARQTRGELGRESRPALGVERAASLHEALENGEFVLGERSFERGRRRL